MELIILTLLIGFIFAVNNKLKKMENELVSYSIKDERIIIKVNGKIKHELSGPYSVYELKQLIEYKQIKSRYKNEYDRWVNYEPTQADYRKALALLQEHLKSDRMEKKKQAEELKKYNKYKPIKVKV